MSEAKRKVEMISLYGLHLQLAASALTRLPSAELDLDRTIRITLESQ